MATTSSGIVCLGGGIESLPILQAAKRTGRPLIVIDGRADAPGMALADVPLVASCYDVAHVIAALGAWFYAPSAVICAATDTPHVAAAIAGRFGLPGLMPAQAALSVDKHAQKTHLLVAGVPVPVFGYAYGPEDLLSNTVVKPADSRGARGVVRMLPSVDPVLAYDQAQALSPTGHVVVENWISGPQLSTESLVQDGRVLFTAVGLRNYDRFERGEFGAHPVEDGFSEPYGDAALLAEVNDIVERGCAALGWRTLTCKADLVIHNGRIVILELAARLSGGFFSTHGHPLAYGMPFVDYAIRLALGESIEAPREHRGLHVCQRYVFGEPEDVGKQVVSVPDLLIVPNGVVFRTFAVRSGDIVRSTTSHADRLGQAIATGMTPEQARERAEAAVKAMKKAIVLE